MDLYCPICLEPWDNDTLHDVADEAAFDNDTERDSYAKVAALFRTKGCGVAFFGTGYQHGHCRPPEPQDDGFERSAVGIIYELLGDDMDGAASMMEDLGL